jgi:polar amino acid transport system substrate-binding protein
MRLWQFILGGAVLCSAAASEAKSQTVRVFTEHLPPYQIVSPQQLSGFATEVVRRTFEQAGVTYKIEASSWSRAYQMALRQPASCIYSISHSEERQPLFHWIGAISSNITAFYALKKRRDIQLSSLADAKSYVTAVTRDDITHHYLLKQGFKEGEQLYLLENIDMMLNLLQNRDDIDLVILNDTILKYRAEESGVPLDSLQKKLALPDLLLDFHLACSLTTNPELVKRLQQSLQQLKDSGEFDRIVAGWSEQFQQESAQP